MIDPFSLATGIVGIASLAIQVAQIAKGYIDDVEAAPEEIRNLAHQLGALAEVLNQLGDLLRSGAIDGTNFGPKSSLCIVRQSCEKQLQVLYKRLNEKSTKSKNKIQSSLDRLKWPLEKKEAKEVTRRLHECSQTFQFCLNVDQWCVHGLF